MFKSNFKVCGDEGPKGDNGLTPHIGKNGNWYLGEVDTGIKAQGPRGQRGFRGEQGIQGLTGPTGATGPAGQNGAVGPQGPAGKDGKDGIGVHICDTSFEPHTTQQIDDFSQFGHTESFDISHILYYDNIEKGNQVALLIPNSDTNNKSMYFGLVTQVTETSIVCDSIGCIHGAVRNQTDVFVVPSNGTFRELKVKLSKRKNTVMANLEVNLASEPSIGYKWFSMPEGYRPVQGTSFYTILGGAIVRCAIMPNGDLQMIEKISGDAKIGMDYTVTFNYVID